MNTIKYRGMLVRLARSYSSWNDYQESEDRIDSRDVAEAQRLVRECHVDSAFDSCRSAHMAIAGCTFPGYGFLAGACNRSEDGTEWRLYSFNIPETETDRVIAVRVEPTSGRAFVVDDFVSSDRAAGVRWADGRLVYERMDRKVLFTHEQPGVRAAGGQVWHLPSTRPGDGASPATRIP